MNIISTESEITTTTEVEPFVSYAPPGYGRDSGKAWLIERVVVKQYVTPNDGFGRTLFHGPTDVSAYGRRLTQKGTPTGARHLIWWLHDEAMVEHAFDTSPQGRAQGVAR